MQVFLDLYNNDIESLGNGLEHFSELQVLILGKNRLKSVEGLGLGPLKSLDVLDLRSNMLTSIASSTNMGVALFPTLSHMTKLRTLNLAGNQLRDMRGVSALQSLMELNLSRNKLPGLSSELGLLTGLEKLFLAHNEIGEAHESSSSGAYAQKANTHKITSKCVTHSFHISSHSFIHSFFHLLYREGGEMVKQAGDLASLSPRSETKNASEATTSPRMLQHNAGQKVRMFVL